MTRAECLIGLTVGFFAQRTGVRLLTAESCTGGLVASWLTQRAGSSAWFEGGVVSYSNDLKREVLGVSCSDLTAFGAVSEPVALAMAAGAVARLGQPDGTFISCAITGVAGPSGGSPQKPVGTVWFAWAFPGPVAWAEKRIFQGDRQSIQQQAAWFALSECCGRLAALTNRLKPTLGGPH